MQEPDMYSKVAIALLCGYGGDDDRTFRCDKLVAAYADAVADAPSAAASSGGGDACRGAGIGSTSGHGFLIASCSLTVQPFGPETAPIQSQ